MQDDVEVVDDDPRALRRAVDRVGQDPVVALQAGIHLVLDRLRLPRVLPGADDEEVRVDAHGPHVEDEDVFRQLALGEAGDVAGLFEGGQSRIRSFLRRPV